MDMHVVVIHNAVTDTVVMQEGDDGERFPEGVFTYFKLATNLFLSPFLASVHIISRSLYCLLILCWI